MDQTAPSAALFAYDPATNTWTQKASMSAPKDDAAADVLGGKLYVVGGLNGGPPLTTVEVYDPSSNAWTSKAPLPTRRYKAVAGAVNGKLSLPRPAKNVSAADHDRHLHAEFMNVLYLMRGIIKSSSTRSG